MLTTNSISGKAAKLFRNIIQPLLTPQPEQKMWEWIDDNVVVPNIVGSPYPGPINSGRLPLFRGLLERLERRNVRFFNLCKSARTGGSLFLGICPVLHKIATKPGPILWLDPTTKTARRLSRQEIQPFIRACKPTDALRIKNKKAWTTLEMIFKTCTLGVFGAGSVADLGGRQGELIVINEKDKIPAKDRAEAPPGLLVLVRSKLFRRTRKIISNSTPTLESGETWGDFLAGSQLHGYLPCPECGGYQQLTFFKEPAQPDKWMRVEKDDPLLIGFEIESADRHGIPLAADIQRKNEPASENEPQRIVCAPDGRGYLVHGIPQTGRMWWPPALQNKKTKVWNYDEVERQTRYECAFCEAKIPHDKLNWMNARYALRSHRPDAPEDIESALIWAAYSPMDLTWGGLAKKYLLAIGNIARMHDCYNSDWGRPFERTPTRITRKIIELMQERSARYERANPVDPDDPLKLPVRPCFLTMQVDVQQTEFWYTLWAHPIDGAAYLLAWGSCVSYQELIDISNRKWRYDFDVAASLRDAPDTSHRDVATETHQVSFGIIDSGYKAKRQSGVYRFVHEQGGRWIASKGGKFQGGKEKPIYETTIAFNYDGKEVDIPFIHYNDDQMQEHLYRFVIKERQHPRNLPVNLDEPFLEQVTSAHLAALKMQDGRTAYEWRYGVDPHLGDCWKLAEIFHFILSPAVLIKMRAKHDSLRISQNSGQEKTSPS
jgi:phage terminase large subunit GpA-like protein